MAGAETLTVAGAETLTVAGAETLTEVVLVPSQASLLDPCHLGPRLADPAAEFMCSEQLRRHVY